MNSSGLITPDRNVTMSSVMRCLVLSWILLGLPGPSISATPSITYDTASHFLGGSIGGMGATENLTATMGQTFLAPSNPDARLKDFTLYAQSYFPPNGGIARLQVRAFVFQWSGDLRGSGGKAVGTPLYMSDPFMVSPAARPAGWTALGTVLPGEGLSLSPLVPYVMGLTLSHPADYAASSGAIEFQIIAREQVPSGHAGGGSAVWLNNVNDFSSLATRTWDTWGDVGYLGFTANFQVVPEPSVLLVFSLSGLLLFRHRR